MIEETRVIKTVLVPGAHINDLLHIYATLHQLLLPNVITCDKLKVRRAAHLSLPT